MHQPITEEGITFLSKEDITAMKLNAIINSGQRLKDFIDIYFLLEHFSIKDMLDFFETKYPNTNPLIALKAVSYFGDIDETADPPKLPKPLPLKKITERINKAVIKANKIFKRMSNSNQGGSEVVLAHPDSASNLVLIFWFLVLIIWIL